MLKYLTRSLFLLSIIDGALRDDKTGQKPRFNPLKRVLAMRPTINRGAIYCHSHYRDAIAVFIINY